MKPPEIRYRGWSCPSMSASHSTKHPLINQLSKFVAFSFKQILKELESTRNPQRDQVAAFKHLGRLCLYRGKRKNHFPLGNYNSVYFFGCFKLSPDSLWVAEGIDCLYSVPGRHGVLRYGVGCAGGGRSHSLQSYSWNTSANSLLTCRMALEPVGAEKGTLCHGGQGQNHRCG